MPKMMRIENSDVRRKLQCAVKSQFRNVQQTGALSPAFNQQRQMKTRSKPVYVQDYTCPICLSVAIDPLGTPCCDQLFCHECLGDALKDRKQCPMDRQPLSMYQCIKIDKDGIEWERWSVLTVSCKEDELGCDWTGIAKEHSDHAKSCRFVEFSKLVAGMKLLEEIVDTERKKIKNSLARNEEKCAHTNNSVHILLLLLKAYE
jgi:hypothetical protein